jgi:hypothetical protein
MGTPTYQPIANITLGSNTASVTFSNITQSYRDLVLVASCISSSRDFVQVKINNDSVSYTRVYMGADTAPTAGAVSDRIFGESNSNPVVNRFDFLDYSATDKHKTTLSRYDSSAAAVVAQVIRWPNTAAINSLVLDLSSAGNYLTGSSFALYGILA